MSEPIETKPAFIIGWEAGASSVTGILLDLIAELRDWDSYYCKAAAADFADRAEARLREIGGRDDE